MNLSQTRPQLSRTRKEVKKGLTEKDPRAPEDRVIAGDPGWQPKAKRGQPESAVNKVEAQAPTAHLNSRPEAGGGMRAGGAWQTQAPTYFHGSSWHRHQQRGQIPQVQRTGES